MKYTAEERQICLETLTFLSYLFVFYDFIIVSLIPRHFPCPTQNEKLWIRNTKWKTFKEKLFVQSDYDCHQQL